MKPSTNTAASFGIGIPLATLLSWALAQYTGVTMTGEVQAALGGTLSAVVGYVAELIRSRVGPTPPTNQGGFARASMLIALAAMSLVLIAGCATTPDGKRELSDSGKSAIQGVAILGVGRYLRTHDNAEQRIANIREVAIKLKDVSDYATVADLRLQVEREIRARVTNPLDQMDALGLLLVFDPVIKELIGDGQVDPQAVIRVNQFIDFLLAALPNIPPQQVQ